QAIGKDPELTQHGRRVVVDPRLGDLSVLDAHRVAEAKLARAPGRWDLSGQREKRALVTTARDHLHGQGRPSVDDPSDLDRRVRERPSPSRRALLVAFRPPEDLTGRDVKPRAALG